MGSGKDVGSSITELIFQSASQKRSFLRKPDPPQVIHPQSPHPVLKIPSHIQILKTSDNMSFDRIVRRSLWLQNNNAYWVCKS